jgi:hypothetical protein
LRPRKKIAKGESVSENLTLRLPQSRVFYFWPDPPTLEDFVSVRPSVFASARLLTGSEGELVQVRISTDPRRLEELLDCLASLPFPINPQLYHGLPTVVEFPAYKNRLPGVSETLRVYGFDPASMTVSPMLEAITAA